MKADAEYIESVVTGLLSKGVPTAIVADVFGLDTNMLRDLVKRIRVDNYGTADREEFVENLQWESLGEAMRMLKHGSPAEKRAVAPLWAGKALTTQSRKPSERTRELGDRMEQALEDMRSGAAPPEEERSSFVVAGKED